MQSEGILHSTLYTLPFCQLAFPPSLCHIARWGNSSSFLPEELAENANLAGHRLTRRQVRPSPAGGLWPGNRLRRRPRATQARVDATDANGYYRFDDLSASTYKVRVNAASFTAAAPLAGFLSSTGASTDTTTTGNNADHGVDDPVPANEILKTA